MKFYPVTLLALFASALSALAQLEVQVVLDQDKFLPAEQFLAGIRIVNRSGQALNLAEDADWAQFSIEKLEAGGVHQDGQPPLEGCFGGHAVSVARESWAIIARTICAVNARTFCVPWARFSRDPSARRWSRAGRDCAWCQLARAAAKA